MEQFSGLEDVPAQPASAIRVLIHLESIPEWLRTDAHLFCKFGDILEKALDRQLLAMEADDGCDSPAAAERNFARSAREYQALGVQTFLPIMALELGIEVLLDGPADAEIGNQRPGLGHIEYPTQHLWLKD
jgi:hypothetical protein